jgi:hypothetical protein
MSYELLQIAYYREIKRSKQITDALVVVVISSRRAHCTARCVLERKIYSDSLLSLVASGAQKDENWSSTSPSILVDRISPFSVFTTSSSFAPKSSLSALFDFNCWQGIQRQDSDSHI